MTIPEEGYLLRVFIGESDRHGHQPLYESIVLQAREAGLAGATVLRGVMGFGKHSVLHTAKILRLSEESLRCAIRCVCQSPSHHATQWLRRVQLLVPEGRLIRKAVGGRAYRFRR